MFTVVDVYNECNVIITIVDVTISYYYRLYYDIM